MWTALENLVGLLSGSERRDVRKIKPSLRQGLPVGFFSGTRFKSIHKNWSLLHVVPLFN